MKKNELFLLVALAVVAGVALFGGGAYFASQYAKPAAIAVKAEIDHNPIVAIERPAHEGVPTSTKVATEEVNNLPEPPSLEVLKKARVVRPQSRAGDGMIAIKGRLY